MEAVNLKAGEFSSRIYRMTLIHIQNWYIHISLSMFPYEINMDDFIKPADSKVKVYAFEA